MAADTSSKTYDWAALVKKFEGESLNEKPTEYQFSKGRQFKAPKFPYQSEIPQDPTP